MRPVSAILSILLVGCAQALPRAYLPVPHALPDRVENTAAVAAPAALPAHASQAEVVAVATTPTYSLDIRLAPVEQLLSALARDLRLDLDLHPGISGLVTLRAFDRPFPELLDRIARQAGLRYTLEGNYLNVMPDLPFLRAYRVDYVNLSRDMNGAVATSTQIATSSSGVNGEQRANGGNASLTKIETRAANHFWESLEANIRAILREHERHVRQPGCEALHRRDPSVAPDACSSIAARGGTDDTTNADFIISNRETGVLMIRASGVQHEKVTEFIDLVQGSARRQVMVEANIVEVTLNDAYRQGIDWSRLGAQSVHVAPRSANDSGALTPTIAYLSDKLDVRLDWLESFGTVKVLSSPRLAVLNNQTAMLKVVEEVVYFLVDSSITEYSGGDNDRERINAATTPQSVSVGLVMALTPQIAASGEIILSVRPTISSISGFRDDPNPSLGAIPNRVPQIRTREIESVLRLTDGELAVLGGLMEDRVERDTGRIPLIGALPVLGELFTRRDDSVRRTELVIFLRPRLVEPGGANGHALAQHHAVMANDLSMPTPTVFIKAAP